MHRFASATQETRRQLLFRVVGVATDPAAIRERLLAKGHAPAHIDRALHLLPAGFEAAERDAANYARDAKASWRTITHETWGRVKGEGWTAPVPVVGTEVPTTLLGDLDNELSRILESRGELLAQDAARKQLESRIAELRQSADGPAKAQERLVAARTKEAALAAQLSDAKEAQALARKSRIQAFYPCPGCGMELIFDGKNLVHYDPPADASLSVPLGKRAEIDARVRDLDVAKASMSASILGIEAQVRAAEQAAAVLAELEAQSAKTGRAESVQRLTEIDRDIADLGRQISAARVALQKAKKDEADRETAAQRTREAAGHHADAVAWESLAGSLSASGIQAEMLADALGPVNAELHRQSDLAGWWRGRIDSGDMGLTFGHRPYALLSESEKWRADAQITAALAALSGVQFMALDRLDVLDLPGRSQAIGWLARLGADGIQTLVLGTLKAPPARVPPGVSVVWLGEQTC